MKLDGFRRIEFKAAIAAAMHACREEHGASDAELAHLVAEVVAECLPGLGLRGKASRDEILSRPVSALNIEARLSRCRALAAFRNAGITYIGDLVQRDPADFEKERNCGRQTIQAIKLALASLGLTFGMEIGAWERPDSADEEPAP